jgi:hypothetical protein
MQFIFKGTYWMCLWAQLQHNDQAKDTLSAISRKLEVIALD